MNQAEKNRLRELLGGLYTINRKAMPLYTAWFVCSLVAILTVIYTPSEEEKAVEAAEKHMKLTDKAWEQHQLEHYTKYPNGWNSHQTYERGHNFNN